MGLEASRQVPASRKKRTDGAYQLFALQVWDKRDMLIGYIRNRFRHKRAEEIEDLVQETIERALRSWKSYNPKKSSLHTWLCTIATRQNIDTWRKKQVADLHDAAYEYTHARHEPRPDEAVHAKQMAELLKHSMRALSEEQYAAISLAKDEVVQSETAKRFAIPVGTLKSRIRLARVILFRELTSRGVTQSDIEV